MSFFILWILLFTTDYCTYIYNLHRRDGHGTMSPCECPNTHDEVTIEDSFASLEQSRIHDESTLQYQDAVAALCKQHTSSTQPYSVSIRDSIDSLERVRAALRIQEQELIAVLTSLDNQLSHASSLLWSLNGIFCAMFCRQREKNDHKSELAPESNAVHTSV
jgi:hypothetical protein